MAKAMTQKAPAASEAAVKAAVRKCLDELEATRQRMVKRQKRIDQLKAETRAMLDALEK